MTQVSHRNPKILLYASYMSFCRKKSTISADIHKTAWKFSGGNKQLHIINHVTKVVVSVDFKPWHIKFPCAILSFFICMRLRVLHTNRINQSNVISILRDPFVVFLSCVTGVEIQFCVEKRKEIKFLVLNESTTKWQFSNIQIGLNVNEVCNCVICFCFC